MDDSGTLAIVQFFQMRRLPSRSYRPQIQRQSANTGALLDGCVPTPTERLAHESD
ncbi:hypothetical protein [Chelatococcus asaccharovorans]|uniref:hypothetical protein n=1 Tax=Chelatococcus asaccharovorans TaxID=28210 RepID=UPI002264D6EB|nr:hypothetical protein [Chelatococcus asaccharovorans]